MEEFEEKIPDLEPVPVISPSEEAVLEDRIFASLSYISVLFIVPWVLRSDSDDIKFHIRQGIALFASEVIVWFALFLLDTFLAAFIAGGEIWLIKILGAIAWIGFAALSLAGVYFAAMGKRWPLPVISKIAQRIRL